MTSYNPTAAEFYNGAAQDDISLHPSGQAIDGVPADDLVEAKTATAYAERARDLVNDGDYPLALSLLTTALKLDLQNANLYAQRGVIYTELQEYKKAKHDLDNALTLDPNHALAITHYGLAAMQTGHIPQAIFAAQRAYHMHPYTASVHMTFAAYYEHASKLPQSFAAYNYAAIIDPTHPAAAMHSGRILLRMGLLGQALAKFRYILESHHTHAHVLYQIGWLLVEHHQIDEALHYFEQAQALGDGVDRKGLREIQHTLQNQRQHAIEPPPAQERLLLKAAIEVAKFAYNHCGPESWQQSSSKPGFLGFGRRQVVEEVQRWSLSVEGLYTGNHKGHLYAVPTIVLDLAQPAQATIQVTLLEGDMVQLVFAAERRRGKEKHPVIEPSEKNRARFPRHELPARLAELVERNILTVREHKLCYVGGTLTP